MFHRLSGLVLIALLASSQFVRAAGVTVELADDTTLRGTVTAIAGDTLTIRALQDNKPPATTTVNFTDVSRIVYRPGPQKSAPQADASQGAEQTSVLGGIFRAIFGDDSNNSGGGAATDSPPQAAPAPPPPPTSRPAGQILWTINLATGDLLHGHITQWADQKISLRLIAPMDQSLEIPTDQLADLWCGTDPDQHSARALAATPADQDNAFVQKDGAVVKVPGTVLGISGDSLRFQYEGAERKISLSRLIGIIPASSARTAPPARPQALRQSIHLDWQDIYTGALTGIDEKTVTLRISGGPVLRIPAGNIYSIDFLGGRLVYLSDLTPSKVTQTPYFGRVIPYRTDSAPDGGPLRLSDGDYPKGIAVHSQCVLEYAIGGNFARFRTKLGFEQPAGKLGRVAARVLADSAVLYENPDARGDQKPIDIDVDVTGRQSLTLEINFGKDQDVGDRVIWANARLLKAK